jgi:peptide-methionine (S)-S-oxide reductase
MKSIVFAGGCFWGVEAYFKNIPGVSSTMVGYANGYTEKPTYQDVCNKDTGFAESCYVEYDETKIDLVTLLQAYWKIIDPTLLDRQGHDIGNQYRTGIYYSDENDLEIIMKSKDDEQKKYRKNILTEIQPLLNFYDAEEYHQKYLDKNPNGYCHIPRTLLRKQ